MIVDIALNSLSSVHYFSGKTDAQYDFARFKQRQSNSMEFIIASSCAKLQLQIQQIKSNIQSLGLSEYWFTSLSAQLRQYRDIRMPEVGTMPYSYRMISRVLYSTINSTIHSRPLNSLEHCICTTPMTNIRPGETRTLYLLSVAPQTDPMSHQSRHRALDAKFWFIYSWQFRNVCSKWITPLNPHDALKHHFTSLKTDFIWSKPRVLVRKFSMKLVYKYMVIIFIFKPHQIIFIHYKSRIATAIRGL